MVCHAGFSMAKSRQYIARFGDVFFFGLSPRSVPTYLPAPRDGFAISLGLTVFNAISLAPSIAVSLIAAALTRRLPRGRQIGLCQCVARARFQQIRPR